MTSSNTAPHLRAQQGTTRRALTDARPASPIGLASPASGDSIVHPDWARWPDRSADVACEPSDTVPRRHCEAQRHSVSGCLIEAHAEIVVKSARLLHFYLSDVALERLLFGITSWFDAHLLQNGGPQNTAAHEIGHLVFFQALGMVADFASICEPPGGRGGWGGVATRAVPPVFEAATLRPYLPRANLVVAEGASLFAGPLAEHRQGGCIYNNAGELLATMLFARRHSDMVGCSLQTSLCFLLDFSDHLYRINKQIIDILTERLFRRHRIASDDPIVAEHLNQVRRSRLKFDRRQAERAGELARLFADAPIDMTALLQSIVP